MSPIDRIMRRSPVIPVLTIEDATKAADIARALAAGGLSVIEVTLRSEAALDAIRAMRSVPDVVVGAGTVLTPGQLDASLAAGAEFIVTPGMTEPLARHARERDVPFLPGVATASEIMRGLELGFTRFKFFPAEAAGGTAALRALSAPFADARFCPTGGITLINAGEWLALPQVLCVGGSWLVRHDASLEAIVAAARAAADLHAVTAARKGA